MSIAKGPEQAVEIPPGTISSAPPATGIAGFEWQGIPIDVLRTFSVDMGNVPTKDIQQLKDITDWAKSRTSEDPSIGNLLQKISEIRQKLGSPSLNQKSYSKVWEYIKFQKIADEAVKRQQSLFAPRLV